jgi:hypothetical protein
MFAKNASALKSIAAGGNSSSLSTLVRPRSAELEKILSEF